MVRDPPRAKFTVSERSNTNQYLSRSPVCGKKGNRRCMKLRHIIECDTHKGRYHSKFNDCVSCAEARARKERASKDAENNESTDSEGKQGRRTQKKGKIKRPQEKSIKQLRREKRQARTSSSCLQLEHPNFLYLLASVGSRRDFRQNAIISV